MAITREKSELLALAIELIKNGCRVFDVEYAKACSKAFKDQASFQDSASVINPSYNFNKSYLLLKQADALDHLIKFIEAAKECDTLKAQIFKEDQQQEKVNSLFI